MGFQYYIDDNSEWIPTVNTVRKNGFWYYWPSVVGPYLNDLRVFQCPSSLSENASRPITVNTPKTNDLAYWNWFAKDHVTLGYNYGTFDYNWPSQKIGQISRPSSIIDLCDSYGDIASGTGEWACAVGPQNLLRYIAGRHNGRADYLLFDWHVESRRQEDLYNRTCYDPLWCRVESMEQ
jgi:prepilin-type processing-associated H-X9-DG protein